MKTLLIDIETSPLQIFAWGVYEQDALDIIKDWRIMAFSYKWLGEKKTHVKALPDYKTYKRDRDNDYELVKELWKLFNEADLIVAHNGDKFDIRKTNARFIKHNLGVPKPYKTVDTLKIARKYFKFDSNRLNDLGKYLGLGNKVKTGGIDLWLGCIAGDMKSWDLMKKYNKQDVVLLEKVYLHLRPWHHTHPNMNIVDDHTCVCPLCGSDKLQKRGFEITDSGLSRYQRYHCKKCGRWSKGRSIRTDLEVRT